MAAEVSASPDESPSATGAAPAAAAEKPRDYNPHWKGYVYIGFCSLVNFASLVNVPDDARHSLRASWAASVTFGVVTFALSGIIVLMDRFQMCIDTFHYTQALSGNVEGFTLIFFTFWWIAGVAFETRVGGFAYFSNNIYFSSWASLASCLYTLNEWSTDKDYLSFQELTSLSATLKSWYVLFLSSLIVMGTSANLHGQVAPGSLQRETSLGVAAGLVSTVMALFFILVHYHCFGNHRHNNNNNNNSHHNNHHNNNNKNNSLLSHGGWLELGLDFLLILLWIIVVAILTQVGGVGSTFSGTGCLGRAWPDSGFFAEESGNQNCSLVVNLNGAVTTTVACSAIFDREIPGSNLYLASWICLAATLNITLRWKAQQALQFAHAAQHQQHLEDVDDEEDNNNNAKTNNNAAAAAKNDTNNAARGTTPRRRDQDNDDDDDVDDGIGVDDEPYDDDDEDDL